MPKRGVGNKLKLSVGMIRLQPCVGELCEVRFGSCLILGAAHRKKAHASQHDIFAPFHATDKITNIKKSIIYEAR